MYSLPAPYSTIIINVFSLVQRDKRTNKKICTAIKGGNILDTPFTCSVFFGRASQQAEREPTRLSECEPARNVPHLIGNLFSVCMIKVSLFWRLPRNFSNSPTVFIIVFEVVFVVAFVTLLLIFLIWLNSLELTGIDFN